MKTANKCYQAKPAEALEQREWFVVDAKDQVLGRLAVRIAKEGDTVVIAGKGHEEVQILGERRVPFRDSEEVVRALRGAGSRELAVG